MNKYGGIEVRLMLQDDHRDNNSRLTVVTEYSLCVPGYLPVGEAAEQIHQIDSSFSAGVCCDVSEACREASLVWKLQRAQALKASMSAPTPT